MFRTFVLPHDCLTQNHVTSPGRRGTVLVSTDPVNILVAHQDHLGSLKKIPMPEPHSNQLDPDLNMISDIHVCGEEMSFHYSAHNQKFQKTVFP